MAQRILRAGHDLLVFDTEASARSAFQGTTAEVATSLTELASECGIVCLCLPGPAEVEQVMSGRDGIGSTVRPGTLVVDHTTNSPTVVRQVGEQLRLRGAALIDAPVSGGIEGAAAGTLTALIGGEPEHVERARPLLEAFSTAIVHVGPLGAGTVAKLMNNLATFALDQVIGECLTIGARAGIEPDRLLEALQQSAIGKGGNLHVRMPDTFMKGDFEPRFTLAGAHKDVRLAVGLAEESGVPIRIARAVLDEIESALSKGLGDRDASIVMTLQEERAGVHISSRSHAT
ncbi:MAG: NAD(P)-dependent oxidoreductase [Chloroflexi bacterium]|nr:NAD(P)-dependent oxidoreductase [Chloroflexota bacterium]MCI0835244.1 NAD(P)-dependent oxidoreductase [Chloroflexota bacterium]MCI0874595.1 NAD(P)-dependent oxidoreductase [Chloroflexota bacterium]